MAIGISHNTMTTTLAGLLKMVSWLRYCAARRAEQAYEYSTSPLASIPAEQLDYDYEATIRGVDARVAVGGEAEREHIKHIKAMLGNPYDDSTLVQFPAVRIYQARTAQVIEVWGPAAKPDAAQTFQLVLRDLLDPNLFDKSPVARDFSGSGAATRFIVTDVSGLENQADVHLAPDTAAAFGVSPKKKRKKKAPLVVLRLRRVMGHFTVGIRSQLSERARLDKSD